MIDRLDEVDEGYGEGNPRGRLQDRAETTGWCRGFEDIFSGEKVTKNHADYYFQTFLYAAIVRDSAFWNEQKLPVSPALLFISRHRPKKTTPCCG